MNGQKQPGTLVPDDINSAIWKQNSIAIWENALSAYDINSAFYTTSIKFVTLTPAPTFAPPALTSSTNPAAFFSVFPFSARRQ